MLFNKLNFKRIIFHLLKKLTFNPLGSLLCGLGVLFCKINAPYFRKLKLNLDITDYISLKVPHHT